MLASVLEIIQKVIFTYSCNFQCTSQEDTTMLYLRSVPIMNGPYVFMPLPLDCTVRENVIWTVGGMMIISSIYAHSSLKVTFPWPILISAGKTSPGQVYEATELLIMRFMVRRSISFELCNSDTTTLARSWPMSERVTFMVTYLSRIAAKRESRQLVNSTHMYFNNSVHHNAGQEVSVGFRRQGSSAPKHW